MLLQGEQNNGIMYIERNYATSEYVESVKNKEGNKEKETMTKDEFERFYNFVLDYPNIRIKTAMLIFLNTGVRKEELVGLTWENINFEESKLSIYLFLTAYERLALRKETYFFFVLYASSYSTFS